MIELKYIRRAIDKMAEELGVNKEAALESFNKKSGTIIEKLAAVLFTGK